MTTKKKLFVLAAGYQLIPLLLIAAWIMPTFFDLFGVSWNDRSWRMYAATAGRLAHLGASIVCCGRRRDHAAQKTGLTRRQSQ